MSFPDDGEPVSRWGVVVVSTVVLIGTLFALKGCADLLIRSG